MTHLINESITSVFAALLRSANNLPKLVSYKKKCLLYLALDLNAMYVKVQRSGHKKVMIRLELLEEKRWECYCRYVEQN